MYRPAWFYQRLFTKAPLHQLSKEAYPDDATFWTVWALCPPVINLKILRNHFTAHSWLNWSLTVQNLGELMEVVLTPRRHMRLMPLRAFSLLGAWGFRGTMHGIFGKNVAKCFDKFIAYGAALTLWCHTFTIMIAMGGVVHLFDR